MMCRGLPQALNAFLHLRLSQFAPEQMLHHIEFNDCDESRILCIKIMMKIKKIIDFTQHWPHFAARLEPLHERITQIERDVYRMPIQNVSVKFILVDVDILERIHLVLRDPVLNEVLMEQGALVGESHPMKANFSKLERLIAQTKQAAVCLKTPRTHAKTSVFDSIPIEVLENILKFAKPYSATLYVNKTWSSISYKNSWRNVIIHDSTTAKRLLFILGIKSNHRYRLSHPHWPTLPCPLYVDFLIRWVDDRGAEFFLRHGSKLLNTSCIKSFSMAPDNPHGT